MFLQAHRLGGVEEVTYPRWKPGQLLELKRIDRWVSWLDYPTLPYRPPDRALEVLGMRSAVSSNAQTIRPTMDPRLPQLIGT